jgi:hypothetical protein
MILSVVDFLRVDCYGTFNIAKCWLWLCFDGLANILPSPRRSARADYFFSMFFTYGGVC